MSLLATCVAQLLALPSIPVAVKPKAAPRPPRDRHVPHVYTANRETLVCTKCRKDRPLATGYYIRKTGNATHVAGAPMQPCRPCLLKKQAEYRERQRTTR